MNEGTGGRCRCGVDRDQGPRLTIDQYASRSEFFLIRPSRWRKTCAIAVDVGAGLPRGSWSRCLPLRCSRAVSTAILRSMIPLESSRCRLAPGAMFCRKQRSECQIRLGAAEARPVPVQGRIAHLVSPSRVARFASLSIFLPIAACYYTGPGYYYGYPHGYYAFGTPYWYYPPYFGFEFYDHNHHGHDYHSHHYHHH